MAASADELRQEMARIRAGARGKAFQLKHETKQLLEWKRYLGLVPWGILGSALLAGYFLVPTRRSAPRDDTGDEQNERRRESSRRTEGRQESAETVKRAGLLTAALGFAGTVIYRAGLNYATRRLVEGLVAPRTTAPQSKGQEQTYEFRRATSP